MHIISVASVSERVVVLKRHREKERKRERERKEGKKERQRENRGERTGRTRYIGLPRLQTLI